MRLAAAILLLALAAAFLPTPAATVERVFALGIYPPIQHVITPITNAVPVAVLDILLVVVVVVVPSRAFLAIREAYRQRRLRPALDCGVRLAAAAAAVYLVFLAVWGMNYRRVPMEARILLERPSAGRDDVMRLGQVAVRQLNALYREAHDEGWNANEWRDDTLRSAFTAVQTALSDAPPAVPGRLKQTLLGAYFRWTGVDGMVNPFGLEVIANPDLLPFERSFVAAHEWAHLAGYADESEANFVGWLTCIRASPAAQYSGWLYLYWQISGEVADADRAALSGALTDGPRRDLSAIVDRLRRGQLPLLRRASWLLYDEYLKANRVEEGVRSYGAVVNLILRAKFAADWMPVRRDQ